MTIRKGLLLLSIAFGVAACDNNDDIPPPPETGQVRFVHAAADAPDVNVLGDSQALAEAYALGLAFGEATPLLEVETGTATVAVDALLPGGTATVIGPVDLEIAADTDYNIIAAGEVGAQSLEAIVVTQPTTTVDADSVEARVVHAAANAPAVDVYVTAPSDPIDQATPLGTIDFGEDLGPVEVPAGDYRIRVTLAGDMTAVFDSGTVGLPAGSSLLIVAVPNAGPGDAPISLAVSDGSDGFAILDATTPAELRVVHASPDAPNVDVIVNDDFANPVLVDVPYPAFSDYLPVPAGEYNVKVTPTGNPSVAVIDADVELEAGTRYSAYATGLVADIAPLVTVDDNRSVATAAKLRALHLAPSAGLVDLYVVPTGTDISTVDPTFSEVDFLADTGFVELAGGSYDVTITLSGTTTPAIGPATITVEDGGVYTAAARDETGGGPPFGLILMDDFAAP